MEQAQDLDALLTEAVKLGASDIHLAVGSKPRYRIYGSLQDMNYKVIDDKNAEHLLMTKLDALARSTLSTTGNWDMAYQIQGVGRFRVNIFKQKGALAGVFRVLNEKVPDYTKLGLPLSIFNLYRKRRGLVLVVGVTGSGKSTTLASFIDLINKSTKKHIITLEDPIEYIHWHSRSIVNQREIGKDVESFQSGLRAALREDPDVILVGEMRDLETVDIALTAAETGHLVCSTLHTMSTSATVNRIINMYPVAQQKQIRDTLSHVLEAVIAQQLLPKADNSGYVVAYEVLFTNKEIRKCIRNGDIEAIDNIIQTESSHNEGMCGMDEVILRLYSKGQISKDTALDYSFDRREMARKINSLR